MLEDGIFEGRGRGRPKKIFIKQVSSDASMQTNCELKVAVRDRDQCEGEL